MTGAHNLARLAEESHLRLGDRESLWFEGKGYRSGALHERSSRLGAGLTKLGIRPGDRVMVLLPNSPEVGVTYVGLWRAGAVITPAMFLLSDSELRHILETTDAVAVVTAPELLGRATAAAAGLPSLRWIICTGPEVEGFVSLDQLAAAEPGEIVPRADADLAALLFTGGTTGRSKGVMLSHHNLWFCARASHEAARTPGPSRSLIPLPLSHAFGLILTVVGLHSTEANFTVLQRWFEPLSFLESIQEHRLEVAAVVPSMLQILLAMPLEAYDLSSLHTFVCGAAPLSRELGAEVMRRIPGAEIREGYGLTESSAVISTNRPGSAALGSVGRPLPGYEVRILDPAGAEVPPGDAGEICVRSEGVMQGYWKEPELTAKTIVDGWLHTGDVGRFDAEGNLHVIDRIKDLVIRGGFNVFPRDVEDALLEHPDVAAAGVVGRPDPRLGEEVVAFVSLKSGAAVDEARLVEFARDRLGAHKYPREIHVVDLVPLTPVGKIDRKALRALAGEHPAPAE